MNKGTEEQLKALADPIRMRIVRLLALSVRSKSAQDRSLCACDIEAVIGLSQSTVSHHMKVLCSADLAQSRKSGRWVYYSIQRDAFAKLSQLFAGLAETSELCGDDGDQSSASAASGCGCEGGGERPDLRVIAGGTGGGDT